MSACDDRDPEACWDCGAKDGLMPCRYCWNCQHEELEWRIAAAREQALKEAESICRNKVLVATFHGSDALMRAGDAIAALRTDSATNGSDK